MKFKEGDLVYIIGDSLGLGYERRSCIIGKVGKIISCLSEYEIYETDVIDLHNYYVSVRGDDIIKINCD